MKSRIFQLPLLLTLLLSTFCVSAQQTGFTYQGQLSQAGSPHSGTVAMTFSLFDALESGGQVGSQIGPTNVTVNNGLFAVDLDFGPDTFGNDNRFLEITVGDQILVPRQAIRPAPLALFALSGNEGPEGPEGASPFTLSGSSAIYLDGNVGIGVANPTSKLQVAGRVRGDSSSFDAIVGVAPTRGIRGTASDSSGVTIGVMGEASSTSGRGIVGNASAASGSTRGVVGQSNSPDGRGVDGIAFGDSGETTGVRGQTSSISGTGVYGFAANLSGSNFAVRGLTNSSSGYGGYFVGPAGSRNYFARRVGIGNSNPLAQLHVRADSSQPDPLRLVRSNGIEAMRVNSTGNVGIGTASPGTRLDVTSPSGNVVRALHADGHMAILGDNNAAVFAQSGNSFPRAWLGRNDTGILVQAGTGGASAGTFDGNVTVNGNLSKASGSFKIDHPLDPEHMYLFHSFVESPDMMNIYNGNIVTDETGQAEVVLPDYFEALNMDFRYQLTVIGTFAQAIVAEEIVDNHFIIATDQPGIKVSWQVTGIRNDDWARKHRIEVEVLKPEEERGQYLYPEVRETAHE